MASSAKPVYFTIVFYLKMLISVVTSSEGDTLIEPTPRGNSNFELIQPSYVPIADFELVFQNSLLLFRGDTTVFDFQVVQQFFIPILHVVLMDSHAKNSTFVYRQIGLFRMTMMLRNFVHRQYMVHGVGMDCENMHLRWRKWGAGPGISWDDGFIDLYPMNILVLTTLKTQRFYDSCVFTNEYDFWERISKMNFVFFYDTEAEKRRDCYVICDVCKSDDSIRRNDTNKFRELIGPVWRSWDETNVLLLMEEMRNNVSENGRNIHWKVSEELRRQYLSLLRKSWKKLSEFKINIIGTVQKPAILRQHIFQIAVLSVLFHSEPKDDAHLEIRFTKAQVTADDVIFISSEQVKYREGDSPLDFYLTIFDVSIWIFLGTAIIATSSFYSVTRLLSNVPGKVGTAPQVATVQKIRMVSCEFLAMFTYLSMAFLAQFPRDLPSCNQKNVGFDTKSRIFLIPWIFGSVILNNWYSAFIESSFKFPFPYELKQGHWREFENYSVYVLINQKHVLVEEHTYDQSWMTGSFETINERFQLKLDVNDTILEIRLPWSMDEDLPGYKPFRSGFAEMSLGGDCGLGSWPESSRCAEPKNLHLFFIWFKREWLRIKNCSHNSSHVEDLGSQNPCIRDKKAIDKIRYRIDSIDYHELSWYVGHFYQNLTEVARKIGAQLLKKFPDDYEYEASLQCLRNERMSVKESFVQMDYINESITSTTSMKSAINTFYWMTRRQQAVFVVTRAEFPWYWNLFKNLMNQNRTLMFAHTGPKSLKNLRPDRGLTGNGFESPVQIHGTSKTYLPEAKWMLRRIRALTHSGILGFLAKWDLLLYPPVGGRVKFFEEVVTDAVPLFVTHDSVKASFIVLFTGVAVAVAVLAVEHILNAAFI